jgi:hypothetical protein
LESHEIEGLIFAAGFGGEEIRGATRTFPAPGSAAMRRRRDRSIRAWRSFAIAP